MTEQQKQPLDYVTPATMAYKPFVTGAVIIRWALSALLVTLIFINVYVGVGIFAFFVLAGSEIMAFSMHVQRQQIEHLIATVEALATAATLEHENTGCLLRASENVVELHSVLNQRIDQLEEWRQICQSKNCTKH